MILVMKTERTLDSGSSQLVDVSNVFKLLHLSFERETDWKQEDFC